MPSYRYPVLIVRDTAGGFSAISLEYDGLVGFGSTSALARLDLEKYLTWMAREIGAIQETEFLEPLLQSFTVKVRSEYRSTQRIYPSEEAISLRVPCVTGVTKNGQRLATLPLLEIRFSYEEPRALKGLVQRYAAQKLDGLEPAQLARYLPPPHCEMDRVVVRVPREATVPEASDSLRTLSRIAEPLGDRAVRKQFSHAREREKEVQLLTRKLHGEKGNVLLVGEPGTGKSTVLVETVREVERRLTEEQRTEESPGRPRRYWQTSAGRIIAGMKYLGQWEERVEALIAELGEIEGVLCVDRLLDLVRTGGYGPTNSIAAFLLPYLTRGELRLVAEATPGELDACRRLLPGLVDTFQIVLIPPFDRAQALAVLDRQFEASQLGGRLSVSRGVSDRVVQLFRRFMPYASFPGPAVGFTRDLLNQATREGWKEITPEHVVQQFMQRTGLPELFLRDETTLDRETVLATFRAQVIDQPEACESAANVVMTFKAGLNDPNRPLGVLLFCGPTGVGKTEMAQALARYFYGGSAPASSGTANARLIRLDMSEYSGVDAVERLLGPPHGEPSDLIRRMRQQPFTVLLLDEIEKAADDVYDVLLGVFDEGRLTDPYGRVTNFRSSLIVMTSNLGAGKGSSLGFDSRTTPRYRDEAMAFFRPEFFNRIDALVTFEALRPDTIRAITRKELEALARREGVARFGMTIQWSDRLIEHLAHIGYDARYGARPLQRTIEREVVVPLSRWLLGQPTTNLPLLVSADWVGGVVTFRAV